MQTCSVCLLQSTDEVNLCPRCGANLREMSLVARARAEYQANHRVTLIRVMVADNACPACAAVEGAYSKDRVPELPVEGCSHPLGCRCFYQPVLAEVFP